jgi:NAD(P)-dependent dehydrogenase (short-subunit alcohol dehydrogenase family)
MSPNASTNVASTRAHQTGVDMGTVVVTGARGVGYEVGRGLAGAGHRVIFGVRNRALGETAAAAIRTEHPSADVTFELLDLADLASVAACGDRLAATRNSLDVLVNNAGVVMPPERQTTADGFELHFGTNHLGHFALAAALLPLLKAAHGGRVVVVGSLAHRRADIDFDNLQSEQPYRRVKAYGQSKLANLLFMTELQRRSDQGGWGLTSTGAHPGFARTDAIMRPDDGLAKRLFTKSMSGLIPTAAHAARPIIYAATSGDVTPAGYYGPSGPGEIGGKPGRATLAARAQDPVLAAKLWGVSEALAGVRFTP